MIGTSNPKAQYLAHREEILSAVSAVLEGGRYVLGEEVKKFEAAFAKYCASRYAVGLASGTDALVIALKALQIGAGDEVITVSHTAVATAAAIELTGARPVFVDIEPGTFTMDPHLIEAALTAKTRAIVPVHLYGRPCNMAVIMDIARRRKLFVVEDCAQATGGTIGGRKVGTWGDIGCFSFYPTKNLSAIGDGGIAITPDDELARRMTALREYGWDENRNSQFAGQNSRLDEIQAAILNVKLAYLDADNERRRTIAGTYNRLLSGTRLVLPQDRADMIHVYHLYVAECERREDLLAFLKGRGVAAGIHYPVPIHLQGVFLGRYGKIDLPHTEAAAARVISLPMYPELDIADLTTVTEAIGDWEKRT